MQSAPTAALVRLQWLAGGFLLTFSSAFGQTFFIALFASELKGQFGLSDGAFGSMFMVAALASATVLIWLGRIADRRHLRWASVFTLIGLAATAAAMACITAAWMLLPILFGLRLFGQGLLGHISLTAMARWFAAGRGRAIAIAATGFPASQAILPIITVALLGSFGWRMTWWVSAAALLVVPVPLILLFFRREPQKPEEPATGLGPEEPVTERHHWTRAEVLRDPAFYALMPGVLAPPFVITGTFFHQAAIVHAKGWELSWFVGWYAAHAVATTIANFATGWGLDRFGAARALPGFLAPLVVGVTVLAISDNPYAVPAFMVLSGLSLGGANTVLTVIWAELYGTRHLGSIRALASSGSVFASALAPGVMGYLFDIGVTVAQQFTMLTIYTLLSAGLLAAVAPHLRSRA